MYVILSSHYTVSPYPANIIIETFLILQSLELLNCMADETLPCLLLVLPLSLFKVRYLSDVGAFLDSGATNNAVSLCHTVVEGTNLLKTPIE